MMDVTKVKLLKDQVLFERLWLKGTIFYITAPYRQRNSTVDFSDVFLPTGENVGAIRGYFFDYGDKKVFERVKTND